MHITHFEKVFDSVNTNTNDTCTVACHNLGRKVGLTNCLEAELIRRRKCQCIGCTLLKLKRSISSQNGSDALGVVTTLCLGYWILRSVEPSGWEDCRQQSVTSNDDFSAVIFGLDTLDIIRLQRSLLKVKWRRRRCNYLELLWKYRGTQWATIVPLGSLLLVCH